MKRKIEMKIKLFVIFYLSVLFSFFTGCSEYVSTLNLEDIIAVSGGDADSFYMKKIESSGCFTEYLDTKTDIHYIIYSDENGNCISPRYSNAAGELYTD